MEAELINNVEGLEGELGYKGERGYSAYEIAVKNGFEGTEQDWLDHFGLDLTDYIKNTDVINNLTSDTTDKPLSAAQGKELKTLVDSKADSSSTYSKSDTDSLLNTKADSTDVILKDDIAVISGTENYISSSALKNVTLDYPSGFNKDNCVVISKMCDSFTALDGHQSTLQSGQSFTKDYKTSPIAYFDGYTPPIVILSSSNIIVQLCNPLSTDMANIGYKIVLLKLPETEA